MLSMPISASSAAVNPHAIIKTPPQSRSRLHSFSRYNRCFCCHNIPDSPLSADDDDVQPVLAREPRRSKLSRIMARLKSKMVESATSFGNERSLEIPRGVSQFRSHVLTATSLAAREHDISSVVNCLEDDDTEMSMHALFGEDSFHESSTTAEKVDETPPVLYSSMEQKECFTVTPYSLSVVDGSQLVDAPKCHPSTTIRRYMDVKDRMASAMAWGEKETQCSETVDDGVLDTATWGDKDTTHCSEYAEDSAITTPCGAVEGTARVVMKDEADAKLLETTTETTTQSPRTRTDSKLSPELTATRYGGDQPENTGCSAEEKTKNSGGALNETFMQSELTVIEPRTSTTLCAESDDALRALDTAQRLVELAKPVLELAKSQRGLLSFFCDRLGIDENLRPQSLSRETDPSCASPSDVMEQFSSVYQYQMDFMKLMNQMVELGGPMEHSFKKNAQRDMLFQKTPSRASAPGRFYVEEGWRIKPDDKDASVACSAVGYEGSRGDSFEDSLKSESSDGHQILVPHSVASMELQDTLLFQIEQELLCNSQQEVSFIVPPDCPPGTDVRFTHNRCTYKVTIGPDHFAGSQMHVRVGKPPPLSLRERKEIHDFVRVGGGPMQMQANLCSELFMDGDLANYNLLGTATSQRRLAAYHALQGQNMHPLLPDVHEDGESAASSLDGSRRSFGDAEQSTEHLASPSASSTASVKGPGLLDLSIPCTTCSEDPAFSGTVSPNVDKISTPASSDHSLPTLTCVVEKAISPLRVPDESCAVQNSLPPLSCTQEPRGADISEPVTEPFHVHRPAVASRSMVLPFTSPNSVHLSMAEPHSTEKLFPLMRELSEQSTETVLDYQDDRDERADDVARELVPDFSSLTIPFISREHSAGIHENNDEDALSVCDSPTNRHRDILADVPFCSARNACAVERMHSHSSDTLAFAASPSSHRTTLPHCAEQWESCVESLQSCDEAHGLRTTSSRMTAPPSPPSSLRFARSHDADWHSPHEPTSTSSHSSSSSTDERQHHCPQLEDPRSLNDVDCLMGRSSSNRRAKRFDFDDSYDTAQKKITSAACLRSSLASLYDEDECESSTRHPLVNWLDDTVAHSTEEETVAAPCMNPHVCRTGKPVVMELYA